MTLARRPEDVPMHDWHHALINERVTHYRVQEPVGGLQRLMRHEAERRAIATIKDHLHVHHDVSSVNPFATVEDLIRRHDKLHRGAR